MEKAFKDDEIAPVVAENETQQPGLSPRSSQTQSDTEVLPGPDNNAVTTVGIAGGSDDGGDNPETNGLRRDITMRQIMLMAAGGSIGAGLFVSSGQALSIGGPGSVLINFAICGAMVSITMAALGEMATSYPVAGAFYDYTVRFVGKEIGFAMGWNFVFNWLIVLPFELTTIGAQVRYWQPSLQSVVLVGPFIVFLGFIAFMGARWFGELEHWLGLCKAATLTIFLCFALALVTTGARGDPRGALGDRYWHDPGAFRNGFQGFLAVFRVAGMSYGGTELLGLTAAECTRPHRIMPVATKVVFFRLVVFYMGSLLMLGLVVPANSPGLATVGHGAKYSPFVLAANLARVPALANLFNGCIVLALLSMANAAIFASSRALQALCRKGMGPSALARVRDGVPTRALAVSLGVSLLAFVTAAPGGDEIFDWLLSLSAMSNYLTWSAICASHIRMRRAVAAQGRDPADFVWRSPFGLWGSYLALLVCACGLLAQVVMALWPVGGVYAAKDVVRDIVGLPFMLAIFAAYYCHERWWRPRQPASARARAPLLVPLAEIDLATGFRDRRYARLADEEHLREKESRAAGRREGLASRLARRFMGLPLVATVRRRLGKRSEAGSVEELHR